MVDIPLSDPKPCIKFSRAVIYIVLTLTPIRLLSSPTCVKKALKERTAAAQRQVGTHGICREKHNAALLPVSTLTQQ